MANGYKPARFHRLTVRAGGDTIVLEASEDKSLLSALRLNGFSEPSAPCGGNGTCRQCRIHITGSLLPVDAQGEPREARDEELLACRWRPGGDCSLTLPQSGAMRILVSGVGDIEPGGEGLGAAVDIGTTTVAVFIYDRPSGRLLASRSNRNAQRPFGADVISRIRYSDEPGGLEKLAEVIRGQLGSLVGQACRAAGREAGEIRLVSIAGNTVMEHLFAGLSPVGIGVAPFTPVSLFGDERSAEGLIPGLFPGAEVYLCPALAGYVGGDITAGLMSSGAAAAEKLCLFMDIGTNGEMGLGDSRGYICCATAAGPAFEGAEIACGMDGSPGAVDKVTLRDGEIRSHVVGDIEARGICGSGLVDALAVMLRCGAVTGAGRLLPPEEAPEAVRSRLRRGGDGVMRFYLTENVFVSAGDIRELQLAKAAIRAGAETLMALRGVTVKDVDSLLIAGGFGQYMDVDSALAIGLLPPIPRERIRHVGNAAGAGAALALVPRHRSELETFTAKCSYHELSASRPVMDNYLSYISFDEQEDD